MKWIVDDLKAALAELRQSHTWIVIGMIGLFGLLTYMVGYYAFSTDSLLLFLRRNALSCASMTNANIIALFTGMIFFSLSALLTLGELQRYFQAKQRGNYDTARKALIWAVSWMSLAIAISFGALYFFKRYCY